MFLAIFAKKCGQKTVGLILNIVSVVGSLVIVPIIVGMLADTKEQANQRQVELVAEEVKLAYTLYLIENNGKVTADDFCNYMTEDYFETDGYLGMCLSNSVNVIKGNNTYSITYSGAGKNIEIEL